MHETPSTTGGGGGLASALVAASGLLVALASQACTSNVDPCRGRVTSLDTQEPDDDLASASSLVPGATQERTIHCAGGEFNEDYVLLETEPGRVYTRIFVEVQEGLEPILTLIDPSGSEVAHFADSGDEGMWLAPEGRYHVRLSAGYETLLFGDLRWDTARFTVRFDEVEGDIYEPDDTMPTASDIASGEMQEHTLTYHGDVDTVRFTVTAGVNVQVFIPPDQLNSQITPVIKLLDGAGNDVAAGTPNWDISSGGFWTATQDGTYYVTVSNDVTGSDFIGPKVYKIEVTYAN